MTKRDCATCVYQELADTAMPCQSCITSWSRNGTWTGYEPAAPHPAPSEPMCQDLNAKLSDALASAPHARQHVAEKVAAIKSEAAPSEPVAQEPTSLHRAARAVVNYRPSMSYNESYFGEPAGLFKSLVADLERALPTRPIYAAAPVATAVQQEEPPMFWVRLRSDGGYEGPIHNDAIEEVRKRSGTWRGLYLEAAPAVAQPLTPLTDEQMLALTLPISHDAPSTYAALCYESGAYSVTKLRSCTVALIRAVERAHGIGTTGAKEEA